MILLSLLRTASFYDLEACDALLVKSARRDNPCNSAAQDKNGCILLVQRLVWRQRRGGNLCG